MTRVDRLLNEYAAAFNAGDSDPWPYLDQVEGEEREELDRRMDEFLAEVEPVAWDPEAFADSPAKAMADRIAEDLIVPPGGWPELLPSLRLRREMKREEVETRLAEDLDASGEEQVEKVATYYHDMEHGNLEPRGVSDSVLDSLARIYSTTLKVLRRAGSAAGPPGASGAVFARRPSDTDDMALGFVPSEERGSFSRVEGKPDRIDRLFTDPDYEEPGR